MSDHASPSGIESAPTPTVPPALPATLPPGMSKASPGPPPPLIQSTASGRQALAVLLSLALGLFLADALISLADDALILGLGSHILTSLRVAVFLIAVFMALVIYLLIGLTPSIPKKWFLPLTLFNPAAQLAIVPCLIYFFTQMQLVSCLISLLQVVFGLGLLYGIQGGIKLRWALVTEAQVAAWRFSWRNLLAFLLVNVFLFLPATLIYLGFCAALAVQRMSDGFMALRWEGLAVRVTTYVRNDGKTIQLVPMSHIGEPDFYRALSQSFPSNALVLMEGVTDRRHRLTNELSYHRMAAALGLSEQQKEFAPRPSRGKWVPADVDTTQFGQSTVDFLNLAMLLPARGFNANTLLLLTQNSPSPEAQKQLLEDLLHKRNRHLLKEIEIRLAQADHLIVPWGVAHMPELAKEIQKSGFRPRESQPCLAVRFGGENQIRPK